MAAGARQRFFRACHDLAGRLPMGGGRVRGLLRPWLPDGVVEIGGVRMHLHPRDNFTEHRLWCERRPPEARSLALIEALVRQRRCLFVDAGANCGVFTLHVARAAGGGSRIVAVEPSPVMAGRLRANLGLNGLDGAVEVVTAALGAAAGSARLSVHATNHGASTLRPLAAARGAVAVPVVPLEALVADADGFDVFALKIDVEGWEDRVLLPFLASAPERLWPGAILLETDGRPGWAEDLLARLLACGYRETFRGEGNAMMLRPGAAPAP